MWPRPPRWFTDSALQAKLVADLPSKEARLLGSDYFLQPVKHQRLLDHAWLHFNHLKDKHVAEGTERTIREWTELICVPSGWEGGPLLRAEPATAAKCGAKDFAATYAKHMALLPNAGSIRRPALTRKFDQCLIPCQGECGLCGEAFCSRKCMVKLGVKHRKECKLVFDNGYYVAHMITLVEMRNGGVTPEEMQVASGGVIKLANGGSMRTDNAGAGDQSGRVCTDYRNLEAPLD